MDNTKYVRYLVSSTLGTFAGAVTGYLIGHFLLMNAHTASTPGFMQFLPSHLHGLSENIFNSTQAFYSKYNFWILFTASFTPIHYGLFSISAGIFKTNIIVFCFVTLLSQSLKFYLLAVVTTKLSLKAKMMFKLNLKPAIVIASICLALALLITRVL
jgi:membrane protein YqaA with SNARE-associated domain